jgi:DNA-nicking Smr family endonuclease
MARKPSEEELRLWNAQLKGVKPLSKEEKEAAKEAKKDTKKQPLQQQVSTPHTKILKKTPDPQAFARQDLRRLKVETQIDLHGMTLNMAQEALEHFLHKAQEKGIKTVLVITGKGSISSERTIRHQLPLWVREEPFRQMVLSLHHPAKIKDGGAGAYYIRVKKSPRAKNLFHSKS